MVFTFKQTTTRCLVPLRMGFTIGYPGLVIGSSSFTLTWEMMGFGNWIWIKLVGGMSHDEQLVDTNVVVNTGKVVGVFFVFPFSFRSILTITTHSLFPLPPCFPR